MNISQIREYENNVLSYKGDIDETGRQQSGVSDRNGSSLGNLSNQSGQIITGKVVNVQDNTVSLQINDNQTVSARIDGAINIIKGQTLSFEVVSNENQIALRPLYANVNASSTVLNALSAAGLQATDKNISMVKTMMDEGMSVNKNALYSILKDVNEYPDANPATIVQLNKLSMPINELNINQFENYKNFEYKIIDDTTDLSSSLADIVSEFADEGNYSQASEILSMISSNTDWDEIMNSIISNTANEEELLSGAKDAVDDNINNSTLDKLKELMGNISETDNFADDLAVDGEKHNGISNDLMNMLKEIGLPEDKISEYKDGKLSEADIIGFVKYEVDTIKLQNLSPEYEGKKELLDSILNNSEFKTLFKDEFISNWTLKPQDVADEKKVQQLYERINEQSAKLMQIFSDSGKENTPAMKSAQNVSDNVDFMNQLNQMMNYVQLPLKMADQKAHGDLYVYTRKKNLASKDGNVSALLHLDMDNLGPMDVYVAMQNNRVNTHFYMQDVATLDFIEANIHLLDERLSKKGYDMHSSVTTKDSDDKESMADIFLKNCKEEGTVAPASLTKLSFDMRA